MQRVFIAIFFNLIALLGAYGTAAVTLAQPSSLSDLQTDISELRELIGSLQQHLVALEGTEEVAPTENGPRVTEIDPAKGAVGTTVELTATRLSAEENTVYIVTPFGKHTIEGLSASRAWPNFFERTVSFSVPASFRVPIDCPNMGMLQISNCARVGTTTPGYYAIGVMNAGGERSNLKIFQITE